MKIKPLPSSEILSEYLKYDYSTGHLFWKKKTGRSTRVGSRAGRLKLNNNRYISIKFMNMEFQTHRVIWKLLKGVDPKGAIDHINGNPADNRIENLREASASQNLHNQKLLKRNNSGIKGVCWDQRVKSWKAYITLNSKKYHIGYFRDLRIAERAIKRERIILHKEFSNHG